MKAIEVVALEGPASLRVGERPEPIGPVIVDVHAVGVVFPDTLLARGLYQLKPELPFVPGGECAGVVRSAPEGSGLTAGDRVAVFSGLGGCADTVAVHPTQVFPIPDALSFVEAAALPLNYLTMHFALARRGQVRSGEQVLVHGAAGGIGTASIQIAKHLGARVIAVVSDDERESIARQAGADEVVRVQGFLEAVRALGGVDVVVDPVGGDRFTDSLRALRPEGRMLVIGFTGGEIPEVKVNRLLLNNISVVGVGWGAFWMERHPGYPQEQWRELLPAITSGAVKPIVTQTLPLEHAAEAFAAIEERRALGRIVLEVR
jgi:NADPH2:quinone reductase